MSGASEIRYSVAFSSFVLFLIFNILFVFIQLYICGVKIIIQWAIFYIAKAIIPTTFLESYRRMDYLFSVKYIV